ncbi:MAG: DUF357 domain-containing protein [Candidatus Aenigmarchaeota archaeon]|nr:DUF357 domain-containing protein [Candidatus Aenigmarchaeota archaeon]
MEIKEELEEETQKWLEKIKKERENIILSDSSREDFLENIDAYISDSEFFLEHEELIEAFEAVIWGWAMLELGQELGILEKNI